MPRTTGTCAREKPVARAMAPPYHFHSLTVTSPHTVRYHSPLPTVRLTCTTPHVVLSPRRARRSPSHPSPPPSPETPRGLPSQGLPLRASSGRKRERGPDASHSRRARLAPSRA